MFGEVCEQYGAIVDGRAPRLPARRPFRDYLQWLGGRDPREAEEHWRRVLSGFDSPTPLPYDRQPVEAHRAESSESMPIELPVEQSRRLHEMARRNGLTVNTVVQGAWALLLARYSGERDVVFGTTVSGRPAELPGVESMIGMFINTVPTRVDVDGGRGAVSWLRELQEEQTESRNFDFVSLAQLKAWSDVAGAANLFDSLVVFENYPIEDTLGENGIRVSDVEMLDTTSLPLALSAYLDRYLFCCGYTQTFAHLHTYCKGLLSDLQRKSVEPIALASGCAVRTLQEFLRDHQWQHPRSESCCKATWPVSCPPCPTTAWAASG